MILIFGWSLKWGLLGLVAIKFNLERVRSFSSSQGQRSRKIWFFCELKIFLTRTKPKFTVPTKSKNQKIYALKKKYQILISLKFWDFSENKEQVLDYPRLCINTYKNWIFLIGRGVFTSATYRCHRSVLLRSWCYRKSFDNFQKMI